MTKKQGAKAPRPSGPTQSNEARRAAGRVQVLVWLTAEENAALVRLCARDGRTKRDVIGALLVEAT